MIRPIRRAVTTAALAVCLTSPGLDAQGAYTPSDPFLTFEMRGPAAMQEVMKATNLAALLDSEELGSLTERGMKLFEDLLSEADDEAEAEVELDADAERLLEILRAYGGRLTVAASLELPDDFSEPPRVVVVFTAAPDENTDFAEVIELFERRAESREQVLEPFAVDEFDFRAAVRDDGVGTMPQVVEDQLVVFLAQGMDKDGAAEEIARVLTGARREPSEHGDDVVLDFKIDIGRIARGMIDGIDEAGVAEFLETLGFGGLEAFAMTLMPAGPHAAIDVILTSDAQGGSILDVMQPGADAKRDLFELAPRSAAELSTSYMRFDEVYDRLFDAIGYAPLPMAPEDLEGMFEEQFKVRLRQDLIEHIGSEVMTVVVDSESEEVLSDNPMAGQAFAVRLRNADAFGKSLEKMLRSRGLHASRKTDEYQGVKVRNLVAFGVHYAFVDDLLVVGVGASGAESLRLVLDAAAARKAGEDPGEFPGAVTTRLEYALPEWQGFAVADFAGLTVVISDAMRSAKSEVATEFGPDAGEALALFDSILELCDGLDRLLRRFDLDIAVSTSAYEPGSIRTRMIW